MFRALGLIFAVVAVSNKLSCLVAVFFLLLLLNNFFCFNFCLSIFTSVVESDRIVPVFELRVPGKSRHLMTPRTACRTQRCSLLSVCIASFIPFIFSLE